MHKWLEKLQSAVFLTFSIVLVVTTAVATAESMVNYEITDTKIQLTDVSLVYNLVGTTSPVYTVSERFSPFRVVIDVAGAKYVKKATSDSVQIPENKFAKLTVSDIKDLATPVKRFIFTLAESHDYNVETAGNDIVIKFFQAKAISSSQTAGQQTASSVEKNQPSVDETLDSLIVSSEQLLRQDPETLTGVQDAAGTKIAADDFSFSGYKKTRISVDFYKIDIHNVFRLFRQINPDLNIIVDQSVAGSLTLALNDVPWDFALDIILNLKNLKKEERFNTIVIYPADKEFVWPTRAEDNLEFETDIDVIEQESLVIEQAATQSPEIMKAKEYMVKAQLLENLEKYEEAAFLFGKALELWPDNSKISNHLSTLYLVHLGVNAKAVYYAKENLKVDPQNTKAALYAAIGSANMQRIPEASDYFAQSISGTPPMKEALISYAAFSENNGQNEAALKLIDKYHSYYGETVDTMISKARILDGLGRTGEATSQYQALLASGFRLRPDLKKYISGRVAVINPN